MCCKRNKNCSRQVTLYQFTGNLFGEIKHTQYKSVYNQYHVQKYRLTDITWRCGRSINLKDIQPWLLIQTPLPLGFPGGAMVKNLPANAGNARDTGSILGSGRYPGVGNDNPPQYYYLENSKDKGAGRATIHGVTKSQARLSMGARECMHTHKHTHTYYCLQLNDQFLNFLELWFSYLQIRDDVIQKY